MSAEREEVKDLVRKLAMHGKSKWDIRRKISRQGLEGHLEDFEFDEVIAQAGFISYVMPQKPFHTFSRIVGLTMIAAGASFLWIVGFRLGGLGIFWILGGMIPIFLPALGMIRLRVVRPGYPLWLWPGHYVRSKQLPPLTRWRS